MRAIFSRARVIFILLEDESLMRYRMQNIIELWMFVSCHILYICDDVEKKLKSFEKVYAEKSYGLNVRKFYFIHNRITMQTIL